MTTPLEYNNLIGSRFSAQIIIPELAKELGLEETIVVQQLHYWLQRCGKLVDNAIWIYNSFDEWSNQFSYWSVSKIKRIFYSLERQKIIFSKKINKSNSDHTKWYTIDYNKLSSLLENSSNKRLKSRNNRIVSNWNDRSYQIDTIINNNNNNNKHNNNLSKDVTIKKPEIGNIQTEFLKIEEEVCKSMIEIWKNTFISSNSEVTLTHKRKQKLQLLWDKIFDQNPEKWKGYCIAINSSKFLMGEKKSGFKAQFDWLIEEGTAKRVLAGDFDIGDRVPDVEAQMLKVKTEEQRKIREKQREQLEEQNALEEEKRKANLLAEKLAYQELQKLEAAWSEEEKGEIQKTFENYMEQEVIEDEFLASFRSVFSRDKWASHLMGYVFEQFKIKFCLKKKFEDFMLEAEKRLNHPCLTNIYQ